MSGRMRRGPCADPAGAARSGTAAMEECKMWCVKQKRYAIFAVVAIGVSLAACGDSDPVVPEPTFDSPSTVRVVNRLLGPVIFFFARPCGTSDWGADLFGTDHPIEGTIQPGSQRDFTVEAGCYDFRAVHLETTEPGDELEKLIFNQTATPVTPVIWTLEDDPVNPT